MNSFGMRGGNEDTTAERKLKKKHAGLVRVEPTGARGFYESRDSVPTKSPFFVGFSFWWGGG